MNSSHGARKSAAIFDLDGTLVDSMPLVIETFIHAVEPFRHRPTAEEVLAQLGGPLEVCLQNLLGPKGIAHLPAAKERLLKYEHWKEEKLAPFPGARELLRSLKTAGVKLGIWTGRDRWSAERILKIHGLGDFFTGMVCGDDLQTFKPDPAGLIRAVDLVGASVDEAIFIGDADADIMGGHAAGVHTIFIHHGRIAPAHIHARAAEIYAHPPEAYAAIGRHFLDMNR